ncbi:winged helix-turn-helix transcriptional regulator [Cetobacterium somerae]
MKYDELKNLVYKISHKILSNNLKELINDGIFFNKIWLE